ncbi:MAG: RodZ domain-containing protein [Okeania sp.]|nr:RodZ domain-containing protein [Okeania sp.]
MTGIKNLKKSFSLPLKQDINQTPELSFEEEQIQALKDIGNKLKMFRDKHSISLEKVAIMTMIRINLLEAIEEGNLEPLPEPVYIQGMIKRYADAIGLDGEELANLFPTVKTQEIAKKSIPNLSRLHLRPYHLYLLYILLIVLSVRSLSYVINNTNILVKEEEVNNTNILVKEEEIINTNVLVKEEKIINTKKQQSEPENQKDLLDKTTAQKPEKTEEKQPVLVNIVAKEESWVSIEIDGKLAFEGTLTQGTQKTWSAQKQLVFFTGNAGGILISDSKEKNIQLGKVGEIKEVVFTPQ